MRNPAEEKLPNSEIAALSDQDLLDLKTELGKTMGRLQHQQQRIRSNLARVNNELKLRREGGRERGDPIVSDHAVVRYLERHRGMDVAAIREEIREIAKRSKYERDEKRNGERLTDEQTGVTMVYTTDRNSIATILSTKAQDILEQ